MFSSQDVSTNPHASTWWWSWDHHWPATLSDPNTPLSHLRDNTNHSNVQTDPNGTTHATTTRGTLLCTRWCINLLSKCVCVSTAMSTTTGVGRQRGNESLWFVDWKLGKYLNKGWYKHPVEVIRDYWRCNWFGVDGVWWCVVVRIGVPQF